MRASVASLRRVGSAFCSMNVPIRSAILIIIARKLSSAGLLMARIGLSLAAGGGVAVVGVGGVSARVAVFVGAMVHLFRWTFKPPGLT